MRISDWSSDVCSSDLLLAAGVSIQPSALAATKPSALNNLNTATSSSSPSVFSAASVARSYSSRWALSASMSSIMVPFRSEEHTSELQSLMRISYAVFCLKKQKDEPEHHTQTSQQWD